MCRSFVYSSDNNKYEMHASAIGKVMGYADYGRRTLAGVVFNEPHSPNSRPSPFDYWMVKLNLRQLPQNMEIPEHYPEMFYKRMPHIAADQIRWATNKESVLIKKLAPRPDPNASPRWTFSFEGWDVMNRKKTFTIDYTIVRDILVSPHTLYKKVKAAGLGLEEQRCLYEVVIVPDMGCSNYGVD
jgi:hypothetical protein